MHAVSLAVVIPLDAFCLAVVFFLSLLREGQRVLQATTSSGHPQKVSVPQEFPHPLFQCFSLHLIKMKIVLVPPGAADVFVKAVSLLPYGIGQIQF